MKINPADNVVVAISDLKAGEAITVDGHAITLKEDVPAGHKVTLKDFAQGENIIKYGYPIGHAVTAVEQGRWINETQIKTNLAGAAPAPASRCSAKARCSRLQRPAFPADAGWMPAPPG